MNLILIIKKNKWLSRLLFKHEYQMVGYTEAYDHGLRYSVRHYRCTKCNKKIDVDGRYDRYRR